MIQAKDLRIGNILNYLTAEGDTIHLDVDYSAIGWCSVDPKGFNLTHSPVKLTEELLIRFGFENVKRTDVFENIIIPYWVKNGMMLFYNEGEHNKGKYLLGFGEMRAGKYHATTIRWIDYAHEVQNAFAITGEELIIK